MISLVEDKVEEVRKICRRYGVARLDLFGSAAGEGFDDLRDSDLRFVVSFERRDPPGSSTVALVSKRIWKHYSGDGLIW